MATAICLRFFEAFGEGFKGSMKDRIPDGVLIVAGLLYSHGTGQLSREAFVASWLDAFAPWFWTLLAIIAWHAVKAAWILSRKLQQEASTYSSPIWTPNGHPLPQTISKREVWTIRARVYGIAVLVVFACVVGGYVVYTKRPDGNKEVNFKVRLRKILVSNYARQPLPPKSEWKPEGVDALLLIEMNNVGKPSSAKDFTIDVAGRSVNINEHPAYVKKAGSPFVASDAKSGKPLFSLEKVGYLYDKTLHAVPAGDTVCGYLIFEFPGKTLEELSNETVRWKLGFLDVDNTPHKIVLNNKGINYLDDPDLSDQRDACAESPFQPTDLPQRFIESHNYIDGRIKWRVLSTKKDVTKVELTFVDAQPNPFVYVACDRPCKPTVAIAPKRNSKIGMGNGPASNMALFEIEEPNPAPPGLTLEIEVRSNDQSPVKVFAAGNAHIKKPL